MNIRSLIVLTAVALPAVAGAAKWERVADTGAAAAYVDRDSLRRNGNQVRGMVEWRWPRPVETNVSGSPRQYVMERQVQVANCDSRSYAVAEGTRYSDVAGNDPIGSFKYDEATLPYMVAPARSISNTVVLHLCAAAPAATTTPAATAAPAKRP